LKRLTHNFRETVRVLCDHQYLLLGSKVLRSSRNQFPRILRRQIHSATIPHRRKKITVTAAIKLVWIVTFIRQQLFLINRTLMKRTSLWWKIYPTKLKK
jgi:hypothetical protein